jgi:hypothetical protein
VLLVCTVQAESAQTGWPLVQLVVLLMFADLMPFALMVSALSF